MKQLKINDARPTREDLIAYIAERNRTAAQRPLNDKAARNNSRKVAADAPQCAALL